MHGLTETTWLEWKRKRRNTLIGFLVIGLTVGVDSSVVFSTLYLYLRDLVKTEQPQMWYGLIVAFYFISSTFFGAFCGRWLDRTRRVRTYVNLSLLVQVIGFLLYVIPFHPVILLVGRTICGMGEPFTSVVSGEVFRIYDKEGSIRATFWLASVFSLGFIIGPPLNFLFVGIEFKIGPIEINNLNFIGIFMAVIIIIVMIIGNFLVHDCSMEFDLKDYLQRTSSDANIRVEKSVDPNKRMNALNGGTTSNISDSSFVSTDSSIESSDVNSIDECTKLLSPSAEVNIPIKVVLRNLCSNKDTMLIFIATFNFMYIIFAASALLALLVTITLSWDLKSLSMVYVVYGVSNCFFLIVMVRYCKSNRYIYLTSIVSIVSQIITCCLLVCLKRLQRNHTRDVVMIVLFMLSITIGWCFDGVLIRVIFANMIPSKIQSFSETLRAGLSRIAIVAASFTVSAMLPWAEWWSIGVMTVSIVLLVAFIIRWKHLINPREIPFTEYTPTIAAKVNYGTTKM